MTQREEAPNSALADLLTERGVPSQAEALRGATGEAPDVLARVPGETVVIEAKKLRDHRVATRNRAAREAAAQVSSRLQSGIADSGVALAYPPGVTAQALRERDDVYWWRVSRGIGSETAGGVHIGPETHGSVDFLARWLMGASAGDADEAASLLLSSLNEAADRLDINAQHKMCETLGLPTAKADHPRVGTVRGFLALAAAAMFHRRLTPYLESLAPPTQEGPTAGAGFEPTRSTRPAADGAGGPRTWPPIDPFNAARREDPVGELRDAWADIIRIDYRPVFETAIALMDAMASTGSDFTAAVRVVIRAADSISRTASGARHDLLGRILHRVIDTARYDGSFYTSAAAATLLATLALRPGQADWADPDAVAAMRVCDPACGSGTLLMAVAERVHDLMADASDGLDHEDRYLVSASLVESVIWGYDINLTACHLAATTLGLLAPSVEFGRMNLFRAPLGISVEPGSRGDVRLGSLDLLRARVEEGRAVSFPGFLPSATVHIDDTDRAGDPPKMDLVIMNPPFTRDSLRHDQFSRTEETRVKQAEKRLLDGHPDRAAARLHSSDGPFLLLGDHLADEAGGTVALVLPAGVATAPGALGRRRFLAEKFKIELIVTSHDPRRFYFSENTTIQEMLLIGRRRGVGAGDRPTRFVNLARNPANPPDAAVVAESLLAAGPNDVSEEFNVHFEAAETVAAGDWTAAAFFSPYLLGAFRSLVESCASLKEVCEVGPAGRRIRDAFVRRPPSMCREPREVLWDHKASTRTAMAAETDAWADMRPAKKDLAESYWRQRSRLLLADRLRLNTMSVMAVRTEWPTVGSAWVPVRPDDDDPVTEKALCAWFNSTLGLLGAYGRRTLKAFSYPRFALDDQRRMPVPRLDQAQASALADAYDLHSESRLTAFAAMDECEVRAQIDEAVVAAVGEQLGVDAATVRRLRSLLAAEPAVRARRP